MNKQFFADIILSNLNKVTKKLGYEVVVNKLQAKKYYCSPEKTCINVGSGDWEANGWLNLDYPTEWYNGIQSKHKIIPFDIRQDKIPFPNNSVDLIYCSHVIEHIENIHIENFFKETYRVLKTGGGIRIATPDAEFLYNATKQKKDYWQWRKNWFKNSTFYIGRNPYPIDYLIREIATPKLQGYTHAISHNDYKNDFENLEMNVFFEKITSNLSFRKEFPGDHINYWTYNKIDSFLQAARFKNIIQSKWNASLFREMQDKEKFDLTYPLMSLYVECVK